MPTTSSTPLLKAEEDLLKHPFGNNSPPFAGLRVIDFSTVAACPAVAQVFALNGADVIKVESKEGCMSRNLLKQFMATRQGKGMHSTVFDVVNRNKESLVLDLKKPAHLSVLSDLLETADVFITNMRLEALERLGLDFKTLCPLYKRLVYVHLSAFGQAGPLKDRAGYDGTAFWTGTGLASLFVEPGHMLDYPGAFGDLTASALLFTGAVVALLKRLTTGSGATVQTSLYETGLWVAAPHLDTVPAPEPNVANRHYETRDGIIAVCHPLDDKADALLVDAVKAASVTADAVQERCALMSSAEFVSVLTANSLVYSQCESWLTWLIPSSSESMPSWAGKVQRDLTPDLKYVPNPSFSLRSTLRPVKQTPGVKLGALNSRMSANLGLWKEVPQEYLIKPSDSGKKAERFKQVTIVEYSASASAAVSGACAIFLELGFNVVRVLTPESENLAAVGGEHFKRHLHHGKTVLDLQEALSSASLLVTDVCGGELKRAGVVVPPSCSVVHFDVMKGALGSWLMSSGITTMFRSPTSSGTWSKLKQAPFQSIDLMASFQIAMAMATALFHAQRCGKAQIADVDFERVCLWQTSVVLAMGQGMPEYLKMYDPKSSVSWQQKMEERALASVLNPMLRDKQWVVVFGANLKKDLPAILKAFRIRHRVYPLCCCYVAKAACCSCGKTKMGKVNVVMKPINIAVQDAMEAMTSEDFENIMAAHELSFYMFETTPADCRESEHARALGAFCYDGGFRVRSPLHLEFASM